MKNMGKLLIIVGTSGTGKSTLIKKIKLEFPELQESISYTTRGMRQGEVHGLSYFFTDREHFKQMLDRGDFLEWATVHDNFYGTSKHFVEESLNLGRSLIFDLDVQGADSMKAYFGSNATAVFIAPPSIDDLEIRLKKRGTDSAEIISLRLENAKRELLKKDTYDHLIVNDDIERAYGELKNIVAALLKK